LAYIPKSTQIHNIRWDACTAQVEDPNKSIKK
jgi:hypothetical protein